MIHFFYFYSGLCLTRDQSGQVGLKILQTAADRSESRSYGTIRFRKVVGSRSGSDLAENCSNLAEIRRIWPKNSLYGKISADLEEISPDLARSD